MILSVAMRVYLLPLTLFLSTVAHTLSLAHSQLSPLTASHESRTSISDTSLSGIGSSGTGAIGAGSGA